jgi:uncharacterized membrane protein YcaP (DUF421 family)
MFGEIDWAKLFVPDTPLLELFLRGTIMYLGIFALMRILRRETGEIGMADILVVVLIADAAQNAMANDYESITDGLFLVVVIIGWSFVLNWLAFQFPRFEGLVHPPPLPLVEAGKLNRRNMRREFVSEEELMSHLREEGVEDVANVKRAALEGDGHISVVKYDRD